jgi:glutamate synthase domain-containing protein 3
MEPVILSCAELSTREINAALAALPGGASARVLEPRGRHNLAVGLSNRVRIDIEGNAGYFIGGLGDGPDVMVHGLIGWSVGENLQAGLVRVEGNASECASASREAAASRLLVYQCLPSRYGFNVDDLR